MKNLKNIQDARFSCACYHGCVPGPARQADRLQCPVASPRALGTLSPAEAACGRALQELSEAGVRACPHSSRSRTRVWPRPLAQTCASDKLRTSISASKSLPPFSLISFSSAPGVLRVRAHRACTACPGAGEAKSIRNTRAKQPWRSSYVGTPCASQIGTRTVEAPASRLFLELARSLVAGLLAEDDAHLVVPRFALGPRCRAPSEAAPLGDSAFRPERLHDSSSTHGPPYWAAHPRPCTAARQHARPCSHKAMYI
jgi:hypothetical protein